MFIFLVVALIKSIHSVKCKKVERNADNAVLDKSSDKAAMTVLLERDFTGNARNSFLIVRILIAYLLIFLFILYIFSTGFYDYCVTKM